MWHVETDMFALAVFLIMYSKERGARKIRKERQNKGMAQRDVQSDSFYFVLVFSIISVLIDIISSSAMNAASSCSWWIYQCSMTIYVVSMPLLAAIWVGYAYVVIHQDYPLKKILKETTVMLIPYLFYALFALSNPVTGLFFELSPQMEYKRGVLFMPVGVGSIMFYSLIGLVLVFFYWKKINPRYNAILLVTFFAITAAFTWVQLAHPGWLIINASYAVIYVWCDFAIEDQRRRHLYQEIRNKNEELEVVAEKAEAAATAKSEFLSRMSHDIRTPMNAIIGLNHLAQKEADLQVVRDYLNKMDTSSKFLLGLINDILDLSKIENGEMTLHETPYTREEFMDSIQTVIKPLIDKKQIHFIFEVDWETECILVDKLRFNQIFFNLLSNAVKFTAEGGTIAFITERIEKEKPGADGKVGLRILVRDNGIGMSEEFQKRMYDPFVQERTKFGDDVGGTGLGLPIVKSLVEAMGGTIEVRSVPDKGTEFKIELYVEAAETPVKEEKSRSKDTLRGVHILLVEDNELNVYVAKTILEQLSAIVAVARNGQDAVSRFATTPEYFFDVILMDVHMPVMNGLEATKAIRALDRADAATVPIIAMTADAFDKEKEEILNAGMDCHLPKPIDPPLLRQTILEFQKNTVVKCR